ncbi:MAG TPA: glycine zipper 2TM domain-containing protein [Burkholderiales bacterium]|nr:glycine zipper 2TM domain-containing protein [Burkholderiales bacterium]
MKNLSLLIALLATGMLLGGCAQSLSGSAYSRGQARQEQNVRNGTVESVRPVRIEGTKTPIGTVAGGAVGGVAGSTVGSGKGSAVAAIIGAVAGGIVGSAAEEAVTRKDGLEIVVKLDSGNTVAITQEADEQFRPGERVRIIAGGGVSRVAH